MKCTWSLQAALAVSLVDAATLRQAGSPVGRVVKLIEGLQEKIEDDGKHEQEAYDKYACWCESTLAKKAKAITNGKETIDKLQTLITKLGGDLAVYKGQIDQLKKDLAQNAESQKEAEALREKQAEEYENDKTEAEQCIGALEAAIGVLTGAGEKKKGFLETMEEAQLLSVAAGVNSVLHKGQVSHLLTEKDMDVVKQFIQRPEQFVGRPNGVSALQNPFGDYAPQSGQIQGILKGMYDTFTGDLEKNNAQEAERIKTHDSLMATKKKEQESLEATLEKQEVDQAEANKKLADSKTERDDAEDELKSDEKFFALTKDNCKTKARQWSERSRLRTEELHGIQKAIEILDSDEAKETFDSSAEKFFLQYSSTSLHSTSLAKKHRAQAYAKLRLLATKFRSVQLAEMAAELKTGGHFDKIIPMIENMMALLKQEEQDDIAHRDRCKDKTRENANSIEDLEHSIDKAEKELVRHEDDEAEIKSTIESLEEEIGETKDALKEQKESRTDELDAFKEAHKDDIAAVELLNKAILSLSKFYKNNKIPLSLVQISAQEPSDETPPETGFQSGSYGGRKGESTGIIAILTMIKEDTEKELADAAKADGAAAIFFQKDRAALEDTLAAQQKSLNEAQKTLAELEAKMADTKEFKDATNSDLDSEKETKQALEDDCGWIETDFDKRREARKAEMEGLVEAKNYLTGVNADDD